MTEHSTLHIIMGIVFILGYCAIIFEYKIKVNKTASAIIMAVGTWILLFSEKKESINLSILDEQLGSVSQIIFFLLGAMTLVELIDTHRGFKIVTDLIFTHSKKKLLWFIGGISFCLSAILDNLTTTVVMVSLLRKIIKDPRDRAILGSAVVITANIGGAWTPIGDVTTTMLWIKGRITTAAVMEALFLPCVFAAIIALILLSFHLKGKQEDFKKAEKEVAAPGAHIVFFCGVGALIFVPVFKALTGLPPFMGILVGLGFLWLITDLMHYKYESRQYLRVPHILAKIDVSGILFFLGILLCISSLEVVGILADVAFWLHSHISSLPLIATIIGLLSAVVDNVPLVAACIGMYPIETFPPDSQLWKMIAYTAGTGGSVLIIGSAAGVAFMGLEKVDFIWYLKKISLVALISFLSGMGFYLLLNLI